MSPQTKKPGFSEKPGFFLLRENSWAGAYVRTCPSPKTTYL